MSPGSYLLVSNFLDDDEPRAREMDTKMEFVFGSGRFRTWDEHAAYFEGLDMVEPGLIYANESVTR